MKHTIRIALFLVFGLAMLTPVFAGVIEDSLYTQVSRALEHKLAVRQQENEVLRQQGLPGNYVVYLTDKDVEDEGTFPPHVLSLRQQHTNQSDVEKIWDFSKGFLQGIPGKLQTFSAEQGYDYYLVICAIYNYFRLDESTDFSNITWTKTDLLLPNTNTSSGGSSGKAVVDGGYSNLLQYLIKKFNKDGSLPKSNNKSHIYHFVMTTYVPFENAPDDRPLGRLRYFQGLTWTSPNTDLAFDAVWKTFYSTKQSELAGTNNAEQKKATKEEWLAGFVNANQTMLAGIRKTQPTELAEITDKPTLIAKLKEIPEAVYAGFSAALRIQMLRILVKDAVDNDGEKIACALVEQTPVAQADAVIKAMREANPYIPAMVETPGNPENNYRVGWCLLHCLTEFIDDKTLGIGGTNNYHRLIKGITSLCYNSDDFKKKAQALNDSYLNADGDKIPDRVIFYTYNSFWSKVAATLVFGHVITEPKLDFSTSYDGCGLQMEKALFFSYFWPNSNLPPLKLDPFEPIVFENQSDLGLLADMDEIPEGAQKMEVPTDHVVPAIVLKYADDKGSNETMTDATMAAIDVASLAVGYGELKAGIQGARRAWTMFDMFNSGVNLTVNLAAYDDTTIQKVLGAYNLATGAIALGRIGSAGAHAIKGYYANLKAARTAMSATAIREFLESVKNAGDDLARLHPDDAEKMLKYLQRLKAEAKARRLKNVGKSIDEALEAMAVNRLTDVFFKNADDFYNTFDKARKLTQAMREEVFKLYKQRQWSKIEKIFKDNDINGKWPPANGGYNITPAQLKKGMKFDRYGNPALDDNKLPLFDKNGLPIFGGTYTSPVPAGGPYNFEARALKGVESDYHFYYEIEVLEDLPFGGEMADVIPWHGHSGGGVQTNWHIPVNPNSPKGFAYTWNDLANMGYIKVTIKSTPIGKYQKLVGEVIKK
jgi:hypothetical protein